MLVVKNSMNSIQGLISLKHIITFGVKLLEKNIKIVF